MTLFSTAFSRMRRLTAPLISPSPVHEKAAIRTVSASGASELAGQVDAEDQRADGEREGADEGAVAGSPAASGRRRAARRGAGLTRIALKVFWKRSPPIICAIANRHGIDAYWIALPIK